MWLLVLFVIASAVFSVWVDLHGQPHVLCTYWQYTLSLATRWTQESGSLSFTGQQDSVNPSNYCCLGILVVADLERGCFFQEGKEYKHQESISEKNMDEINKEKNKDFRKIYPEM